MSAKSCVSCGGELKFNRSTGLFECTFCGKIHTMRGKDVPLSLARVDRDMHAHRFDKAEESLTELIALEPENPLFVLRDILCDFHMTSTAILLSCAKNNPNLMAEIRDCEKWNDLKKCLPNEQQDMIDKIREYCDISLELYETNVRIEKNESYLDVPATVSRGFATGTDTIYKPRASRLIEKTEAGTARAEKTEDIPDATDAGSAPASPSSDARSNRPAQESDNFGKKIFSKLRNKIESTQFVQIRAREDAALEELAADRNKKEQLEKQQQEIFLDIKEMEALL